LFVSLDRMYRFHRRLAGAVAAFLVAHVLLMLAAVASSGDAVTTLLRPDPGWRVFAGVVAFVGFVVVIVITVWVRLRHETFLRVHRVLGMVFAIGALHALRVPAFAGQSPWLNGYLAVVAFVGLASWFYRSGLGRTLVRRYFYEVADIRLVRRDVTEVTLTPLEEPLEFTPGQLVFIGIDDDAVTREQHPFSITSAPGDRELRLVVKAIGDFTTGLRDVVPGSMVRIEGPYGGFWRAGAGEQRQVWIAGGIGVTPFLSIARSLDTDELEIDFYYCTEDADTAVFLDEFYAIADRHPRLRVIPVRADALGFLTAADVRAASGDLSNTEIFMCGPPGMIDALTKQFAELGVTHLHFEDFRLRPRAA
jgi:predicted ferric reductase